MAVDGRLRQIVASVFGVDATSVSEDDSPKTIGDWDSVNHIHLILALEAEYGIQFDPGELADLMSVAAIQRRLAQGSATQA